MQPIFVQYCLFKYSCFLLLIFVLWLKCLLNLNHTPMTNALVNYSQLCFHPIWCKDQCIDVLFIMYYIYTYYRWWCILHLVIFFRYRGWRHIPSTIKKYDFSICTLFYQRCFYFVSTPSATTSILSNSK